MALTNKYSSVMSDVIQENEKPARSRTIYILLAIFLGGLGIHNFYAGRHIWGIIQLLVTLTSFLTLFLSLIPLYIWILIEIIIVTKDADGKYMS